LADASTTRAVKERLLHDAEEHEKLAEAEE
jgi:hypothetical protein